MKSLSTIEPKQVQITNLGKTCRVRLCKNIEQTTHEDEQLYQYDEVVFLIDNRPNLKTDIENNFDIYFGYGERYMQKQKEEEEKTREITRLIDEKHQIEENRILAQQLIERELDNMILAQQLVELELQLWEVKLS
jgi:hypothetical protein